MGIKFDPYLDFNSFPRYGSAWVTRGWSMDFLRPSLTSAGAREILDKHRPIYDPPRTNTTTIPFATKHPEYRSLTRSRAYTLCPGDDLYLSPAFPEAVYRSFCNFPLGGNFSGYRVFG